MAFILQENSYSKIAKVTKKLPVDRASPAAYCCVYAHQRHAAKPIGWEVFYAGGMCNLLLGGAVRTSEVRFMVDKESNDHDFTRTTLTEKLVAIYEGAGFEVHTGWNSYHLDNWRDAPFTSLKKEGCPLNTGGGGISLHEIPCLELISKCLKAERILIIGNSFGWSTLLTSLLWPEAEVAAMDIGLQPAQDKLQGLFEKTIQRLRGNDQWINPKPTYGIELTNALAQEHGLKARAILSASPQDVATVTTKHLGGPPDFVFIDGYHIPPQVILDFDASQNVATKDCVYLFHDVINWGLQDAFERCHKKSGLLGGILWRTPSGMGLLYSNARPELKRVMRTFGDDEREIKQTKAKLPRWKLAAGVQRMILHNRLLKRIKDLVIKPK
jgi:hypothetical protein